MSRMGWVVSFSSSDALFKKLFRFADLTIESTLLTLPFRKTLSWKFCTWKCHTVHIDVHVYFFAVNLVLVGLSEIFSSVFEAIKKLPVSNCSKTYAELYLKELARALFADTYWNVFLNSLGPYVQMCCFLLFFILITFSSLVSFHISLL